MAAVPVSKAELDFTLQALRRENVRVDGRALTAYRRLGLRFGAAHGEVEVNFGPTRALAVCSGEIVTPPPERPNEGRITFHVEFGPIASPSFEVGRPSVQATTVANFIERLLKGSRAVDGEALCIVGGKKVWNIRVDVRALDDDGNLLDVCSIAALCALLHFRKADVEVHGETAKVYSIEERVPVPLSIHHLPVPISFALYVAGGGKDTEPTWILDPNRLEEAAMSGTICVALNQHGELCGLHKPGGLAVDFALVAHCVEVATQRAKELTSRIQSELEADLSKRKEARRNVHKRYTSGQLLNVDWDGTADAQEGPERALAEPGAAAEAHLAWRKRARERAAAAATLAAAARQGAAAELPADAAAPAAAPAAPAAVGEVEEEIGGDDAMAGEGDRDLAAELEAVEAEAAELEAQLMATMGVGADPAGAEEAAASDVAMPSADAAPAAASSASEAGRKKKMPRR